MGRVLNAFVAAALLWAGAASGQEPGAGAIAGPRTGPTKLSPLLAQTLDRMARAGVTPETVRSYDLERFSNPLVRVDGQGRIQVYVQVGQLDEAALRELRAAGMAVELTDPGHGIVEGWVPFDSIETIAGIANVERIRPPDYVLPRSRRVTPGARTGSGHTP